MQTTTDKELLHRINENTVKIEEFVIVTGLFIGTVIAALVGLLKLLQHVNKEFARPMLAYISVVNIQLKKLKELDFNRAEFISTKSVVGSVATFTKLFGPAIPDQTIFNGFVKLSNETLVSMIDLVVGAGTLSNTDLNNVLTIDDLLLVKTTDAKTKKALVVVGDTFREYIKVLKEYESLRGIAGTRIGTVEVDFKKILSQLDKGVRVLIDLRVKKTAQRQGLQNKHSDKSAIVFKAMRG